MKLQAGISLELNEARVGRTEKIVIDRREGEFWIARSQYDSPEVDGEILIPVNTTRHLKQGTFHNVRITAAEEYDLYGIINDE